uniref:Uncharacterized protein n=1 Tax=Arundo donax TaxID=35708 RepID=A0A0A9CHN2_ARUDO
MSKQDGVGFMNSSADSMHWLTL